MSDDALNMSDGDATMVDFSEVDAASFEVLIDGSYNVIVSSAEFKYSAAGNPMWALQLEVQDGDYEGRKLFYHITFSPAAMPYTKPVIGMLMPDLLETRFDPSDETIVARLQNILLVARVTVGTYQGQANNNVKSIQLPSDSFAT